MSKRVNLPTNSRSHPKLLFEKSMPKCCLVNHIDVMCCCLIMHAHSPISAIPTKRKPVQIIPTFSLENTKNEVHPWTRKNSTFDLYAIKNHQNWAKNKRKKKFYEIFIHELQLTRANQLLNKTLNCLTLFSPPSLKKCLHQSTTKSIGATQPKFNKGSDKT